MKNESEKALEIVNRSKEIFDVDLDFVNKTIVATKNEDLGKISKTTLLNISKWALNGASNGDIQRNLDFTEKQFKTFCALCPTVVWIMQQSRERADVLVAGTLLQRAIGGQVVRKRVPVKVGDYDKSGRKIGEHIEYAYQEEELPPDSNLLKFIAEHKLSEKFSDAKVDEDKEVAKVIHELDPKQLAELEEKLKK